MCTQPQRGDTTQPAGYGRGAGRPGTPGAAPVRAVPLRKPGCREGTERRKRLDEKEQPYLFGSAETSADSQQRQNKADQTSKSETKAKLGMGPKKSTGERPPGDPSAPGHRRRGWQKLPRRRGLAGGAESLDSSQHCTAGRPPPKRPWGWSEGEQLRPSSEVPTSLRQRAQTEVDYLWESENAEKLNQSVLRLP